MTEPHARRPELVIFDCDGVLVDSERIAVRVDAIVLADLGWPLSEVEIIERFVGRPPRPRMHLHTDPSGAHRRSKPDMS
jgi:beta-phosphoglucomutase-like phosphatase (HAD superfamily)